jgi:hypothetical protein
MDLYELAKNAGEIVLLAGVAVGIYKVAKAKFCSAIEESRILGMDEGLEFAAKLCGVMSGHYQKQFTNIETISRMNDLLERSYELEGAFFFRSPLQSGIDSYIKEVVKTESKK